MWQDVLGHDDVARQFGDVLRAGRLASTYLFVGPEGVGKRTFALRLAKCLLCTHSEESDLQPCGRCDSCRLFDAGSHPDLHLVEREAGAKFLKIEYFIGDREHRHREGLNFELALKPLVGRRRFAVIDDADWLNVESANALLKTLEEPPPGAVIVLVGTSRSRQLPTILSRAQVVRFGPLPAADLERLLEDEQVAAGEQARELARKSGGSIARARQLADGQTSELAERAFELWMAGRLDPPRLAKDAEALLAAAGKEADQRRQRLRQLLLATADRFRDELRRRVSATGRGVDAPADFDELDALVEVVQRCLDAEDELDRNANQNTLVECWLDDLARCRQGASA
jgi:DNA polymerase-3 subunit delta'